MRGKISLILSVLAVIFPIVAILLTLAIGKEPAEAIIGGVIIGCAAGTPFGIAALILNKWKSKTVTILSFVPILPLAIYLLFAVPSLLAD